MFKTVSDIYLNVELKKIPHIKCEESFSENVPSRQSAVVENEDDYIFGN